MATEPINPVGTAFYEVTPNTETGRFPVMVPVFNKRNPEQFNWKKYIAESTTEADRAFRAHLAYNFGILEIRMMNIPGDDDSTMNEMTRYRLAANETLEKCRKIETLYREILKDQKDVLELLNKFIDLHQQAIDVEARIVGGSWDGGSGAKATYPRARFHAHLTYLSSLVGLSSSLHFQDIPEVRKAGGWQE